MKTNHCEPELFKCKAILLEDDKTILHGFYNYHSSNSHTSHNLFVNEFDHEMDDVYPNVYEINPYTLCRNTGIKLKNGYLYEFDLVWYSNGLSKRELGYVGFDDSQKSYVLRTSLNYNSYKELRLFNLEVIGNILLRNEDCKKMQEYSDKRDEEYSTDPKVECRSTQRLNKIAKQFLPRN